MFNDNQQQIGATTPNPQFDTINIVKKDGFYCFADIYGATAQTAANYGIILVARYPIEVLQIVERHEVAGSSGSAVSLDVLNVPSGTAISAGSSMLAVAFNLKSTADTNVVKEGVALNSNRVLEEGAAIGLKTSGTLTALTGVHITIYFQNKGRGNYR